VLGALVAGAAIAVLRTTGGAPAVVFASATGGIDGAGAVLIALGIALGARAARD
jgi:hypothetical protein